ncbi:gamma carbonic anhydrase family protein [Neisseria sp. ZJ106]|uniref:Gamma carbonic anhydrase family protein n=1 Tax=Neisseria lisongii TaxID=2912188 RepID=A0ABY7RJW9_9NEIS|nr:gamma carbonic anhydrase family protein [Neisseria lisongii]MCF7521405.1 gamma carbonic anhydrase family protein [Neisseria lisongii]WCL71929.1 gamma carbonic anhydrase family protein [Neisseria lisongii]
MNIRSFRNHTPQVGQDVFIDSSAVVIGDTVLGDQVSVWPCVVIRGDINGIRIGKRTNIQDGSVLHVSGPTNDNPQHGMLMIGEDVTIGHNATVHACTLGDRVLIGMGSVILDGAEIGSDTVIGAGSVVPPRKKLEGGWLYMGSPVKAVRALSPEERAALLTSAERYVALAGEFLAENP